MIKILKSISFKQILKGKDDTKKATHNLPSSKKLGKFIMEDGSVFLSNGYFMIKEGFNKAFDKAFNDLVEKEKGIECFEVQGKVKTFYDKNDKGTKLVSSEMRTKTTRLKREYYKNWLNDVFVNTNYFRVFSKLKDVNMYATKEINGINFVTKEGEWVACLLPVKVEKEDSFLKEELLETYFENLKKEEENGGKFVEYAIQQSVEYLVHKLTHVSKHSTEGSIMDRSEELQVVEECDTHWVYCLDNSEKKIVATLLPTDNDKCLNKKHKKIVCEKVVEYFNENKKIEDAPMDLKSEDKEVDIDMEMDKRTSKNYTVGTVLEKDMIVLFTKDLYHNDVLMGQETLRGKIVFVSEDGTSYTVVDKEGKDYLVREGNIRIYGKAKGIKEKKTKTSEKDLVKKEVENLSVEDVSALIGTTDANMIQVIKDTLVQFIEGSESSFKGWREVWDAYLNQATKTNINTEDEKDNSSSSVEDYEEVMIGEKVNNLIEDIFHTEDSVIAKKLENMFIKPKYAKLDDVIEIIRHDLYSSCSLEEIYSTCTNFIEVWDKCKVYRNKKNMFSLDDICDVLGIEFGELIDKPNEKYPKEEKKVKKEKKIKKEKKVEKEVSKEEKDNSVNLAIEIGLLSDGTLATLISEVKFIPNEYSAKYIFIDEVRKNLYVAITNKEIATTCTTWVEVWNKVKDEVCQSALLTGLGLSNHDPRNYAPKDKEVKKEVEKEIEEPILKAQVYSLSDIEGIINNLEKKKKDATSFKALVDDMKYIKEKGYTVVGDKVGSTFDGNVYQLKTSNNTVANLVRSRITRNGLVPYTVEIFRRKDNNTLGQNLSQCEHECLDLALQSLDESIFTKVCKEEKIRNFEEEKIELYKTSNLELKDIESSILESHKDVTVHSCGGIYEKGDIGSASDMTIRNKDLSVHIRIRNFYNHKDKDLTLIIERLDKGRSKYYLPFRVTKPKANTQKIIELIGKMIEGSDVRKYEYYKVA